MNINIISVYKTGTCTMHNSTLKKYKDAKHSHDVNKIKYLLDNEKDRLIIVGVRNPISRDLSEMFQSFDNVANCSKDEKIKSIIKKYFTFKDTETLLSYYFDKEFHNKIVDKFNKDFNIPNCDYFNDLHYINFNHNRMEIWFKEFFNITKINKKSFDKEKGFCVYNYPNNNRILVYTLEKLNENKEKIFEILNINEFVQNNIGCEKWYNEAYKEAKKEITYKKEFLDNLLQTEEVNFFYTKKDIEKFYSKCKMEI